MINRLGLRNFQSHKQTVLEFEPGVNVIIGPSDSGKTSIIRALRWIAWNRPLGDAFRSNWGGDTSAIVKFDDGNIVERLEADNDRHYKITKPDKDFEDLMFEAFGTEVPEEVQKVLNFDEINLQEQMDSPFLISDNPGQVSRHFNKVANIDAIDTSLRNVESWVRSIRQDIQAAEQEIQRYEEKLEEFDYLDKMESDVEVLEQLEDRRNSVAGKSKKLRELINNVISLEEEIEEESELLSAEDLVNKLITLITKHDEIVEDRGTLKHHINNIINTSQELAELKELTTTEKLVNSALDLYNNKKEVKEEYDELRDLIHAITVVNNDVKDEKQYLNQLEEQWHEQAPETCPLCDGSGELQNR